MKKKIVGIFVMTLLIVTTVLPVAGTIEKHIVENSVNASSLVISMILPSSNHFSNKFL